MKCPYCHIEFASQAGFQAHKANCYHKNNPLPEPDEQEKNVDPAEMNAKEVISAVVGTEDVDVLEKWLQLEQKNSNRKTVVEAIEDRIEALKEE